MLDHDDLKWIATNATELNGLLQQVAKLSEQARQHKGEDRYLAQLNEQVEQACRASRPSSIASLRASFIARGRRGHHRAAAAQRGCRSRDFARAGECLERIPLGEMKVPAQSDDPRFATPRAKRELILVVDDDPELLEVAADMLEVQDYQVILAKDGLEALQIYRRMGKKIALIVLDFFLPVMDGDAVFDELKAIDPDVQVVLSSGFGEQAKLGSMLARGLCGFHSQALYRAEKLIGQIRSIIEA